MCTKYVWLPNINKPYPIVNDVNGKLMNKHETNSTRACVIDLSTCIRHLRGNGCEWLRSRGGGVEISIM